jgi:hypothetical protein
MTKGPYVTAAQNAGAIGGQLIGRHELQTIGVDWK